MNDKQWDDYVTRREGTFCGDIAAKNMKSAMKPPEQYFIPKKVVSSPKPVPDKNSRLSPTNKLPASDSTNSVFSFILMIIGFVFGVYYAESIGLSAFISGVIFAILAGFLIPLLRFIFKIVIFAIQLGVIIFIIYLVAKIISSA